MWRLLRTKVHPWHYKVGSGAPWSWLGFNLLFGDLVTDGTCDGPVDGDVLYIRFP